ncbi:MAG: hypothetical protein QFB86_03345 [Patescibacteria group bacterium]|nr:hypothetical protein [Patescibacteria group bacterium]
MPSETEKAACKRKTRYGNDFAAQQALKKINPARRAKMPSRTYKCTVCFGYHLTSSAKK